MTEALRVELRRDEGDRLDVAEIRPGHRRHRDSLVELRRRPLEATDDAHALSLEARDMSAPGQGFAGAGSVGNTKLVTSSAPDTPAKMAESLSPELALLRSSFASL